MAIHYSEGFQRIKVFVVCGTLAPAFMALTRARREDTVFWVSRRIVGACAVYWALRFIADSFTRRDPDGN